MSEHSGTPMPDDLTPLELLVEGIRRLQVEVECVKTHVEEGFRGDPDNDNYEDNDYIAAAMHLSSIVEGTAMISQVLFGLMTTTERAMVAASLFQKKYGIPMRVEIEHIEGLGDVIGLGVDDFSVPDNLEGLDG